MSDPTAAECRDYAVNVCGLDPAVSTTENAWSDAKVLTAIGIASQVIDGLGADTRAAGYPDARFRAILVLVQEQALNPEFLVSQSVGGRSETRKKLKDLAAELLEAYVGGLHVAGHFDGVFR